MFQGSVDSLLYMDGEHHHYTPPLSEDGRASKLRPEIWKALISLGYLFVVTWITAFVMVIVHDRVPDMKKYPPLPDIFLDNVPHIPWAFHMCEVTGTILLFIWLIVLMFHKHRYLSVLELFKTILHQVVRERIFKTNLSISYISLNGLR